EVHSPIIQLPFSIAPSTSVREIPFLERFLCNAKSRFQSFFRREEQECSPPDESLEPQLSFLSCPLSSSIYRKDQASAISSAPGRGDLAPTISLWQGYRSLKLTSEGAKPLGWGGIRVTGLTEAGPLKVKSARRPVKLPGPPNNTPGVRTGIFPASKTTLCTNEELRIELVSIGKSACIGPKTNPILLINDKHTAGAFWGHAVENYFNNPLTPAFSKRAAYLGR